MFSLLAFLPLALASAVSLNKRESTCADVHIILARGNDEPYPGRQGALVESICAKFDSCDYEDIKYDIPGDPYCTTVNNGASGGLAQITTYNKLCPNSVIVLSGYSQGGQVIGDILGGGGGTFYDGCVQNNNTGLDPNSDAGKAIQAALLWGDMRHTPDQSYNIQSGASKPGAFPRPPYQLAGLSLYANVLRSYCVDTDPICARGNDGLTHERYFDNYREDAAQWVKNKIVLPSKDVKSSSSSGASSNASTSSTTGKASASASGSGSASASSSGASATGSATGSASGTGKQTATPTASGSQASNTSSASGSSSADVETAEATTSSIVYPTTSFYSWVETATSIPSETVLSYSESSTIPSSLYYSSPVTIETPVPTGTPTVASTTLLPAATGNATQPTASSTVELSNDAAATPAARYMGLLGMAIAGALAF